MTVAPFLFCSDLDRTLIPNGLQPESPQARPLLRRLADHPSLILAYVSGRDRPLIETAIRQYGLPQPHYAIGDVGSTVYRIEGEQWHPDPDWEASIAPDWASHDSATLHTLLSDLAGLELQEPGKQNRFKLSYYTAPKLDRDALLAAMRERLTAAGVRANLVWSMDEQHGTGLLDVLPQSAGKLPAILFLMNRLQAPLTRTVFAGDSGNDLEVLASEVPAVLVANAEESLRREACEQAEAAGFGERLFLAQGGFQNMNGHYAAGALEGLAHYLPELVPWLREAGLTFRPAHLG